ncbi:MAG: Cell division protein FtsX [Patescibacteria group bacterium]|jgi:cell division transport system permease protein|nr:Cell division protein FtsX [Patescibacteria group bacterium]
MFWIATKRILNAGFVNFWRNGFVSLASVLIMVVTLFTLGAVVFSGAILDASLGQLRAKVDVNVYFMTNAPESDILALKSSLEALPEVSAVEYVSREQALADFKEKHGDDQTIINALAELEDNPLGAVFNVKARETSQYESIAAYLASDAALGSGNQVIIEKVNYTNNKPIIEKLSQIVDSSERLGFVLSIVLILLSVIITFNTVRLAIYTAREEISVMRLVGASSAYVRGPFVVEGIMYGIAASIIVLVLYYPLTLWMGPFTERFFGAINIFDYYVSNFGQMFLLLMAAGIGLGALSSYMAVRRYLKV